jgi:hypothetical protein
MPRLGVNIAFYTGDPYADLVALGRDAEEAGYDCLMVPEGIAGNDALLCCYMLAAATSRIQAMVTVSWYFSGWRAAAAKLAMVRRMCSMAASDGRARRCCQARRRWSGWRKGTENSSIFVYYDFVVYLSI